MVAEAAFSDSEDKGTNKRLLIIVFVIITIDIDALINLLVNRSRNIGYLRSLLCAYVGPPLSKDEIGWIPSNPPRLLFMLLKRSTVLCCSIITIIMLLQLFQSPVAMDVPNKVAVYHKAPPGVDYSRNDTVFGKILRAEEASRVWDESTDLLVFQDIHPRAETHGLIIPKRFIESVFDLTPADVPLLEEMQDMAMATLRTRHGGNDDSIARGDYNLCFHVPPFNSVDHLHLHVLAPQSSMRWYHRLIKYNTAMRWSISLDTVLTRLRQGLPAVPYRKPNCLSSVKGTKKLSA